MEKWRMDMYKKISKNEKVTRKISEVHSADNYLTKEITENVSLAVTKLNGNLDSKIGRASCRERVLDRV